MKMIKKSILALLIASMAAPAFAMNFNLKAETMKRISDITFDVKKIGEHFENGTSKLYPQWNNTNILWNETNKLIAKESKNWNKTANQINKTANKLVNFFKTRDGKNLLEKLSKGTDEITNSVNKIAETIDNKVPAVLHEATEWRKEFTTVNKRIDNIDKRIEHESNAWGDRADWLFSLEGLLKAGGSIITIALLIVLGKEGIQYGASYLPKKNIES